MADWIEEGSKAPDFTLPTHDGTKLKLSSLKGQPVVLYFYPKDDTPGCTKEACGFRDAKAKLAKHKAVILGVSPDSPASHEKFRTKYKLPFTLLADEGHKVAEKYGAWREKNMYGKKVDGNRAEHVHHRRSRQGGEGLQGREGRRPCGAGARRARGFVTCLRWGQASSLP